MSADEGARPGELRNLSSDVAAVLALDTSINVLAELLGNPAMLRSPRRMRSVLLQLIELMHTGLPEPGSAGDIALQAVKRTAPAMDYKHVRAQAERETEAADGA